MGLLGDPSNTQSDLRKVFDRAGYPGITSHTFRRTVATLTTSLQAGVPMKVVSEQLGHSSLAITAGTYRRRGRSRSCPVTCGGDGQPCSVVVVVRRRSRVNSDRKVSRRWP